MQKIVINNCYGGFSLSDEAIHRYHEIKGVKIFIIKGEHDWQTIYSLVSPEKRQEELSADWINLPMEVRKSWYERYGEETFCSRDLERNDPILVQVVEEMGHDADGSCAALSVVEIPDGVEWVIEEYDGMEHIAEKHRTWS